MKTLVENALDQRVRPRLKEHFGDIAVTRIEGGTVYVRMSGHCATCISAQQTVEGLVTEALVGRVPGVDQVCLDTVDPELLHIARQLLSHRLEPRPRTAGDRDAAMA